MWNHRSQTFTSSLIQTCAFFPPYQCGGLNSEARPLYNIISQILLIALTRPSLEMPHKTDSAVSISLPDTRPHQPSSLPVMSRAGLEEKAGFLPCRNSHTSLWLTQSSTGLRKMGSLVAGGEHAPPSVFKASSGSNRKHVFLRLSMPSLTPLQNQHAFFVLALRLIQLPCTVGRSTRVLCSWGFTGPTCKWGSKEWERHKFTSITSAPVCALLVHQSLFTIQGFKDKSIKNFKMAATEH